MHPGFGSMSCGVEGLRIRARWLVQNTAGTKPKEPSPPCLDIESDAERTSSQQLIFAEETHVPAFSKYQISNVLLSPTEPSKHNLIRKQPSSCDANVQEWPLEPERNCSFVIKLHTIKPQSSDRMEGRPFDTPRQDPHTHRTNLKLAYWAANYLCTNHAVSSHRPPARTSQF